MTRIGKCKNVWGDYRDQDGKLLYRLKSCIDAFSYHFDETDPETEEKRQIRFSVTEKRVVSYNPAPGQKAASGNPENGG